MVSAAMGTAQGIMGAVQSKKQRKKMRKLMASRRADAKSRFAHDYYQDLTQRSDMQYLIGKMRDRNRENIQRARNTSVVAGKSTEAEATSKTQGNKAIADATAQIGRMNQQNKQQALDRYTNEMKSIDRDQMQFDATGALQAQNSMMNGATTAIKGLASLADYAASNKSGDDNKTGQSKADNTIDTQPDTTFAGYSIFDNSEDPRYYKNEFNFG